MIFQPDIAWIVECMKVYRRSILKLNFLLVKKQLISTNQQIKQEILQQWVFFSKEALEMCRLHYLLLWNTAGYVQLREKHGCRPLFS